MAIAFDTVTENSGNATAGGTKTISHTTSGNYRILVVKVINQSGTTTGVTYNGVSMTQIGSTLGYGSMWYLLGPASGANNVIISCGASDFLRWAITSYTGVKQAAIDSTSSATSGSGTTMSSTNTTSADNCWIVMGVGTSDGAGGTISSGTNWTLRGTSTQACAIGDTNGVVTPAGATTQTANFSAGQSKNAHQVAFITQPDPVNNTLVITQGSYTLTGVAAVLSLGKRMTLAVGSYTYTGYSLLFTYFQKWIRQSLNSSSITNGAKNSSTWTDSNKNSSSMNNQTKN